jgi:hypothetical protein
LVCGAQRPRPRVEVCGHKLDPNGPATGELTKTVSPLPLRPPASCSTKHQKPQGMFETFKVDNYSRGFERGENEHTLS